MQVCLAPLVYQFAAPQGLAGSKKNVLYSLVISSFSRLAFKTCGSFSEMPTTGPGSIGMSVAGLVRSKAETSFGYTSITPSSKRTHIPVVHRV